MPMIDDPADLAAGRESTPETTRDVQDQAREREAALVATEERHRLALAAGRMATWDWNLATGEVLWNEEHYRMLGYQPGEIAPSYQAWAGRVHPDDRDATSARVQANVEHGGEYTAEFRSLWPDGTVRWIETRGRIDLDAAGKPARQYGVMLDITERKRAESSLERQRAATEAAMRAAESEKRRLEAVMKALPVGVSITDASGGNIVTNPAFDKLWGGPSPHTQSVEDYGAFKAWWVDVGLPVRPDEWAAARAVRYGETVVGQVLEIETFDGKRRFVINSAAPVRDADSGVVGAAVAIQDITQLRQAELALREADRRKNEFLAMLAHELRNPLAAISNAQQVLERTPTDDARILRMRAIVGRQVRHLARLTDDLLDVARVTQGKIQLNREKVRLASCIEHAVSACRPAMDAAEHALSLSVPAQPVWVDADQVRIEQIIGNLLSNAIRYTQPGGQLRLTLEAVDSWAVLRVRDNGDGIEPSLMPHIFEAFTQGDTSAARSKGGLGIGLALVRSIAELHGGTVEASSDGPGNGAEFVVRLPVCEPPGAPRERAAPAASTQLTVLVVDDNRDAAESLSDLLQTWGHAVRCAFDGQRALQMAGEQRPDHVLLDIGMPGMDGYEVARRLRAAHGDRGMRIIALTGYSDEDARAQVREAGFDGHLVKPVAGGDLEAILAQQGEPQGGR